MTKTYDCFPFFNELEILDLRLKMHNDFVDYFVISESAKTFTGNPKPLFFHENRKIFKDYLHKIIHIVVDDFPDTEDPFVREYHQRHSFLRVMEQAEDNDLFIIADADELLRQSSILEASNFDGISIFDMPMFQFYMNLQQSPSGWTACYAGKKRYLKNIENISTARWDRSKFYDQLKTEGKILHVMDAGWHFTHLGGFERLQSKFRSYSHANDPWPRAMMNKDALKNHITAGGIVGNFKEVSKFIPITYPYYPLEINNNQKVYLDNGFIKDVYEAMDELQNLFRNTRNDFAKILKFSDDKSGVLYGLTAKEYSIMADIIL
ncbi:glycosyltransferase family 17 protein [Acetobacter oeni]|uniref:N-acetylglucosaminyltransferase n=1 Tax=Acetobacter oeni TaxID=304077 RepID=A0A511XJE1_9PROT|nr:hypothetical protein [Acetobacter oeni]MBB3882745.1 hypothetical protein [Acetobacter oeni]NHO18841.1 hypothetical protein [Acetobacter oeni]GBR04859.1 N-acetylglucosaminyltransferase [Acetobacter oeni LMG 21952]GEN63066.1 hypothetical protein AOE01nite_12900 [Acetobacter oeni]